MENSTTSVNFPVLVLIGDIVGSRRLPRREEFQHHLSEVLEAINRASSRIISPYTITLGDEFQAVYRSADSLFRHLFYLLSEIHPQQCRFSIAVGKLNTPVNPNQAIGMDGPAFHIARKNLEALKKSGGIFCVGGLFLPDEELINNTLELVAHLISAWQSTRYKVFFSYLDQKSPASIAKDLNISVVSVYKNRKHGAFIPLLKIMKNIQQALNRQLEQK